MDEIGFRQSLEADENALSDGGINTRISKAKKAEEILSNDLDRVVKSDEVMLAALETLQKHENPTHNPMQNAVRKYYKFRNGKDFPRKKDFN